jgi:uncharacterized protein YbaR (Trm112 family)
MDSKLLDVLLCQQCRRPLQHHTQRGLLVCEAERLGYPIVDGIPHLLVQEAIDVPTFHVATPDSD